MCAGYPTGTCPLVLYTLHVKIPTCPVTTGETFFAGVIIEQIVSDALSRCFERCCFIHSTRVLINERMNTARVSVSLHDEFVILTTTLNVELIGVRVRMTALELLHQCFTKNLRIAKHVSNLLIFCRFGFFELLESRHQFFEEIVREVCLFVISETQQHAGE